MYAETNVDRKKICGKEKVSEIKKTLIRVITILPWHNFIISYIQQPINKLLNLIICPFLISALQKWNIKNNRFCNLNSEQPINIGSP